MAVVGRDVLNPGEYLKLVGEIGVNEDSPVNTVDELRDYLEEGEKGIWDFPLDEIDYFVKNHEDADIVVLVTDGTEYRWFEVDSSVPM